MGINRSHKCPYYTILVQNNSGDKLVKEDRSLDIFEYTDFRKFLGDAFESKNKENRKFSKSFICREIGVPNSRSYFGDIINGERVLSNLKTELIIPLFDLKNDTARYFRLMVQFNQTIISDEKVFYLEQMMRMNKAPKTSLDPRFFAYYTDWYHSAIRALFDVIDWKEDFLSLSKLLVPTITEDEAEESVVLLQSLGLIAADDDGFMKPTAQIITSGNVALKNEVIKQYQVKCLELAKNSIFSDEFIKRNISTKTLSLSDSAFEQLTEKLTLFRQEVSSIVHNDTESAEKIYQLNIQLFSQSK